MVLINIILYFLEIALNTVCNANDKHQCKDINAKCKSSNGNKCLCKDAYYFTGNACISRMPFCRTIQLYSVTGLTRDSTIIKCNSIDYYKIRVMVFNATFNNISDISWRSVLLVEETEENYRPTANH